MKNINKEIFSYYSNQLYSKFDLRGNMLRDQVLYIPTWIKLARSLDVLLNNSI